MRFFTRNENLYADESASKRQLSKEMVEELSRSHEGMRIHKLKKKDLNKTSEERKAATKELKYRLKVKRKMEK